MGKVIIYQVLPRLFGNTNTTNKYKGSIDENGSGKFNSFDERALNYFKDLGVTHMWYTGIIEHATATDYSQFGIVRDNPQVVKGAAGSPYAIKDYYDVDPDLAEDVNNRMGEFEALVERTQKLGLKVIIDFVPNHLARNYQSDAKPEGVADFGEDDDSSLDFHINNNFYYLKDKKFKAPTESDDPWFEVPAKATGNDCFKASPSINDWYETVKLNYGIDVQNNRKGHFNPIPDTWKKMKAVLLYWAAKGVDGFRCDMAEMVPVEFWHWCIKEVKSSYPHLIFVAEVYQPKLYYKYIDKGGFDLLYDKVGFYDSVIGAMHHKQAFSSVSKAWHNVDTFYSNMLFFIENHDELRVASDYMFGSGENAWPAWVLTAAYNSNPIMIYNGQEIGERGMDEEGFSGMDGRTTIFDYWNVDTLRRYNEDIHGQNSLSDSEKQLLERYKKLNALLHHWSSLDEGGVYDLMWCNDQPDGLVNQEVYAWLRFYKHQTFLLVSNFSGYDHDTRIVIPEHAFKMVGKDHHQYFRGKELLEDAKGIQFPKEIAMTRGVGVKIKAKQALIYRLD